MPKPLPVLEDPSPICCPPLAAGRPLADDDAVGLAVRLKALADPVRLQILNHLLRATNAEACTCDLAPLVNLSEATVSHHLGSLHRAGLVTKRRDGMNVWYRFEPDSLTAICRVLDPDCC